MALASRSVGAMHGILNAPSRGFSEKPSDPLDILPILLGIWEQDGKQSLPLDQTSFEYSRVGADYLGIWAFVFLGLAACHLLISHTQ